MFHVLPSAFQRSISYLYVLGNARRSHWPSDLRRGSPAARFLGLWVRIPPGAWMFVSCRCFVLSGRGHCVGLITLREESYRVWCVLVWRRSPAKGGHDPESGRSATEKKKVWIWRTNWVAFGTSLSKDYVSHRSIIIDLLQLVPRFKSCVEKFCNGLSGCNT